MSFFNVDKPGSVTVTVGFTVICLVDDCKMPVVKINAAAIINFFILCYFNVF
jgi:hypothetical protein